MTKKSVKIKMSDTKQFVHLHCHSGFTMLSGVSQPEEIVDSVKSMGMEAIALTDLNGLYGIVRFYRYAKESGIKSILGAEIVTETERAVLIAENNQGFKRICEIVTALQLSQRFTNNNVGAVREPPLQINSNSFNFSLIESLKEDSNGIIIISADENLLRSLHSFIPQNYLYVELIGHKKLSHLKTLLSLARELNCPVVGTGDVYFINEGDYEIHKVLTAIKEKKTIDNIDREFLASEKAYLKSSDEMKNLFSFCPEAILNAYLIAKRCNVELPIGKMRFPKFKVPESETDFLYLQRLCYEGVKKRYAHLDDKVKKRLEYELNVINQMGYSSYFLIVWDIVSFAKSKGIPTVGRGSAADSIVSYVLGITNVDPIKYDLYFERFLNPERIDPPDIDIDLCWKRRDEVLDYVYKKYGAEYVAMICTYVTFAGRSTIREVGKVMGLSNSELTTYTQHIPHRSAKAIEQAIELLPESRELPVDNELFRKILSVAKKIDGLPRHLSIHPGGIVISPGPLTTNVPLQYATKGIVVTQYDMYQIEDLGLLKIDLLGQRSLSVIADTVKMIEKNHNVKIDIQNINYEDERLVSLLKEGKTIGCFQIESPGMRSLLKKCKADNYELVVALSSVIRPGPSDSGMMKRFIRRHLGLERVRYTHPSLKEILKTTYGVMVYQEDVLRVANAIAGMSLGRADLLRRAMSKKRSAEGMNAMKKEFIDGAIHNGVSEKIAQEIWRQMRSFAGYAFCKAHSASYSDISFQAVYLKANYPAEFMACVISNGGGFYDTHAYVSEARRIGLKILLPCVNESELYWTGRTGIAVKFMIYDKYLSCSQGLPWEQKYICQSPCFDTLWCEKKTVATCSTEAGASGHIRSQAGAWERDDPPPQGGREGWGIRVGLMQVKGLKFHTIERIIKEREKGFYKSFLDFYERVQPSYTECEILIKAGAFHSFNYTTPQLLWQLDQLSNARFMSQDSHEMNLMLHQCNANFSSQKHTPAPLKRGLQHKCRATCNTNFNSQKKLHTPSALQTPLSRGDLFVAPASCLLPRIKYGAGFAGTSLAGSFLPTKACPRHLLSGVGTTNYLSRGDFKNHDIDVALSGEGFRSCDINVALQRDESRVTSINSPLERGASAGGGVCDSSISEVSNYRVYTIPQLPEYSEEEKLLNEMSTLDVAISHHPLFLYKDLRNICGATSLPIGSHEINLVLRQDSLISSIEMKRYINKKVRMVGWMVTNRRVYAVRGEYMKFLTLEDWDGIYEAVLFPKTYQQYGDLVITRGPYIITGKINNEYGYQTINVDEVELVSDKHLELTEIIKTSESKFL